MKRALITLLVLCGLTGATAATTELLPLNDAVKQISQEQVTDEASIAQLQQEVSKIQVEEKQLEKEAKTQNYLITVIICLVGLILGCIILMLLRGALL